jgi:hypothetical protein
MPTVSGKLRDALGVDSVDLKDQDPLDLEQDRAAVLWDRWTGHEVVGIRLF